MHDLITLHKYYIWANRFRDLMDGALARVGPPTAENYREFFVSDAGLFMSFWYSALYVVIEGYGQLSVSDPRIDELLKSPNTELLRRYRNGVCHFQKDYFDKRFTDFMGQPDTPQWIRAVNLEFGRFFLERLTAAE